MSDEFVHLHVHSPFSFLDGASGIQQMVAKAAEFGMSAMAVTDHDNVCAAPEFFQVATALGVKPIQGVEVTCAGQDGHLTLLARGQVGYAALCRALTSAHLDNQRLKPALDLARFPIDARGEVIALTGCRRGRVPAALLAGDRAGAERFLRRLIDVFGRDVVFVELDGLRLPGARQLNEMLVDLAEIAGIGYVVTNNVHYLTRSDFPTHDLLTCVRTLTKLDDVHPERRLNADNHFKTGHEMTESLWSLPAAVAERALRTSVEIAAMCQPALALGRRRYPHYQPETGETPEQALRRLTYAGASDRYGKVVDKVRDRIEHELSVICQLGYADYFLLVWDVVAFARRRRIRCAGRGSAADSAVAYCLRITDVDSIRRGLLFERFMSLERAEMPDIDVDFDARYRDEVTAYVYKRYGRDRVATVATYNTFHARSAVRDLGKAMGFDPAELDRLAKHLPMMDATRLDTAFDCLPELRDSGLPADKFRRLFAASAAVAGFPRHLSTHLGGVVISRDPLTQVTPLQMAAKGIVVTQFDKIGVEDLGLVKLDLLSLRTLGAVDDALAGINTRADPGDELRYERIPAGDRATYAMLGRGETIGTFQLESPAQRALQARLSADSFEDIVASVALIRPGPIKGNMVEPFIARRHGIEEVTYLHPALEPILAKTYGVVLFQEQVIEIAMAVAGFTAGEADRLRRVMTHGRSRAEMADIGRFFVSKSIARGVEPAVAETLFTYIAGYASYGFCEAHAAAFADIAYKTAYLLQHHPADFFAAILSNQPMGYYPPHVLCVEARRRGVGILPPDVNLSKAEATVEQRSSGGDGAAGAAQAMIRVGLRQVKGLAIPVIAAILQAREATPFRDLPGFVRRVVPHGLDAAMIDNLILAGACDEFATAGNRRELLWRAGQLLRDARAGATPLLALAGAVAMQGAPAANISDFTPWDKLSRQYGVLGFTTGPHPMAFYRCRLRELGYLDSASLRRRRLAPGARVRMAGMVVRPHRPPTRSGRTIVYLSLEDEFGLVDVTIFEGVYDRYGKHIFGDTVPPLAISGRLERRGNGIYLLAEHISPLAEVVSSDGGQAKGNDPATGGRR